MKTVKSEERLTNLYAAKNSVVLPRNKSPCFQLEPDLQNVRGDFGVFCQLMDSEDEKLQYFDFETGHWRFNRSDTINLDAKISHHNCAKSKVIEMRFGQNFPKYPKAESDGPKRKKEVSLKNYDVPSTSAKTYSDKYEKSISGGDREKNRMMEVFDLRTLQVETPMIVPFSQYDDDLVDMVFDGIYYKDMLYNQAQIPKPNTMHETESLSYKDLFSLIQDSCPLKDFEPSLWNEVASKLNQISQFDKSLSLDKIEIKAYERRLVLAKDLLRLLKIGEDEQVSKEVSRFMESFNKLIEENTKSISKQDPFHQDFQTVMALLQKKFEEKKNFNSLYWLSNSMRYYYSAVSLNKDLAKNMMEEIGDLAQKFCKNIAHLIGNEEEHQVSSILTRSLEAQFKKLNNVAYFLKTTEIAVADWLNSIKNRMLDLFMTRYLDSYPTQEDLEGAKSTKLSDRYFAKIPPSTSTLHTQKECESKESPKNDEQEEYMRMQQINWTKFNKRVESILKLILEFDSFLLQAPQNINWQRVKDLVALYEENSNMQKNSNRDLERQIIHKNIVLGNLKLVFEGDVHICIPIYQSNIPVFQSKLATQWSIECVKDQTCSRILHYAMKENKILKEVKLNEGHGEKALLAFVISNLDSVIDMIEKEVKDGYQTNSLATRNLAQMNLDIYTANDLCETCQVLLTHSFSQIYEKIMERLKVKFSIQHQSTRKTLVKRVVYSQHQRRRERFENILKSDLLLCQEPMSLLSPVFLEKVLTLSKSTAGNKAFSFAKRTYFLSIPENQEAFRFYEQKIQSIEREAAENLNKKKHNKTN